MQSMRQAADRQHRPRTDIIFKVVTLRPMRTAPKDRDILVLGPNGWRRAHYVDCQWLRNSGEPTIKDCWRTEIAESDIELNEARGWKPAAAR